MNLEMKVVNVDLKLVPERSLGVRPLPKLVLSEYQPVVDFVSGVAADQCLRMMNIGEHLNLGSMSAGYGWDHRAM